MALKRQYITAHEPNTYYITKIGGVEGMVTSRWMILAAAGFLTWSMVAHGVPTLSANSMALKHHALVQHFLRLHHFSPFRMGR